MGSSVLDFSSTTGLVALVTLTINFLLGLMISMGYKKFSFWKRLPDVIKKINITEVHNWTAYVALCLILIHPLLLLYDAKTKFNLVDIILPLHSYHQPWFVSLGIFSFYAVILVIVSTQKGIKRKLGFRSWKNIHLVSYVTVLLMCIHGLFMDQELKGRQPDFLDGEKMLIEVCFLIIIITGYTRLRYHFSNVKRVVEIDLKQ